jgi:hypothetical protein
VIKSDWCGAQSFRVDDVAGSLHLFDDEVAGRISEFVAR